MSPINVLDVVLILCMVVYAFSGYQQGFIVGACSTVGLLVGGFVGIEVAPLLLDRFSRGLSVSVAALVVVLVLAFLGQALGSFVGHQIRRLVVWRPVRLVDAVSGAVLSVVAMLLIAWVLGLAVTGARLDGVNREVRNSAVLGAVDDVMPQASQRVLSAFNSVVDSSEFPRYLEPFASEHIVPVSPPSGGILHAAAVVRDRRSVVKVIGAAAACNRTVEGSGFVYAPGRVMTNAHVVAGVTDPVVRLGDRDLHARVVVYNPDVDVAVLAVPGLRLPPLHFGPALSSGAAVAVLGYPENGPYDAEPARIRIKQRLRSPNIYDQSTVYRDTYSLYGRVRRGNSGGPVVGQAGKVVGVVFAASVVDPSTGYALTAQQVSRAAAAGERRSAAVTTGGCIR